MGKRILLMMLKGAGFFERRKFRKTLEKGGYEVVGETHGASVRENVDLFCRTRPELVLAELFPEYARTSYNTDILSALRRADPLVPIVVCGSLTRWRKYLTHGAADFIELPADKDTLLERLDGVLSVPRIDAYHGWHKRVLVQQADDRSLAWINLLLRKNGYKVEDLAYDHLDLDSRRKFRSDIDDQLAELFEEDGKSYTKSEGPNLLIAEDLETLKAFRESDPSVPIMICSAGATQTFVTQCIRSGAQDLLLKPFKPEDFLHRVDILSSWGLEPKPEPKTEPEPDPELESDLETEPEEAREAEPAKRDEACEEGGTPPVELSPEVSELIVKIEEATNTKILHTAEPEAGTPIAEAEKTAGEKMPGTGPRVLLAQESPLTLRILRDILEIYRYEIVGGITEGWRCLEFYRKKKPDLVILGTALADGQDGIKILQLLRKEDPPALVLMSGPPEESIVHTCRQEGAVDFLEMPFQGKDLLTKVRDSLSSHRS